MGNVRESTAAPDGSETMGRTTIRLRLHFVKVDILGTKN